MSADVIYFLQRILREWLYLLRIPHEGSFVLSLLQYLDILPFALPFFLFCTYIYHNESAKVYSSKNQGFLITHKAYGTGSPNSGNPCSFHVKHCAFACRLGLIQRIPFLVLLWSSMIDQNIKSTRLLETVNEVVTRTKLLIFFQKKRILAPIIYAMILLIKDSCAHQPTAGPWHSFHLLHYQNT